MKTHVDGLCEMLFRLDGSQKRLTQTTFLFFVSECPLFLQQKEGKKADAPRLNIYDGKDQREKRGFNNSKKLCKQNK